MTDISAITSNTNAVNFEAANPRVPVKTLGQDDFLKLMVTQFTNQDPLNPMKDTEYIAQMTSFTSLEQTKSMSGEISKLRTDSQTLQATSLLGKSVALPGATDKDPQIVGTVTAVQIKEGKPMIVVNDTPYELSSVLGIWQSKTQ
jgi:flagellar basal-body rod modification protein FlgD